jgi:hypothetical protein
MREVASAADEGRGVRRLAPSGLFLSFAFCLFTFAFSKGLPFAARLHSIALVFP